MTSTEETRRTDVGLADRDALDRENLVQFSELGLDDAGAQPSSMSRIVIGLAIAAGLGLLIFASVQLLGSRGGDGQKNLQTHKITRGDLLITITENGTLESSGNIEVRCEVAGGSEIKWIVDDGTIVDEGQTIVELDDSKIVDLISQQEIACKKAKAAEFKAKSVYEVARISVTEYFGDQPQGKVKGKPGIFEQERQILEANIDIAEKNYQSALASADHAERMFRRGYISDLQRDAQRFAVRRSELERTSATIALNVLTNQTRKKKETELTSSRDAAKADWESERDSYNLELARLKRLKTQKANCTIIAPRKGMIVYANERSRRSSSSVQIDQGVTVKERQVILRLPDLSRMRARVSVHESKIARLSRRLYRDIVSPVKGKFIVANAPPQLVHDAVEVKIDDAAEEGNDKKPPAVRKWTVDDPVKLGDVLGFVDGSEVKATVDGVIVDVRNDGRKVEQNNRLIKIKITTMRASIKIPGRASREQGTVMSIANQPEPSNWFNQGVKNYACFVEIEDSPENLKPGMTVAVSIIVDDLQDVLRVPVAAIIERGNQYFCWVKTPNGSEQRLLLLGQTNDKFFQVLENDEAKTKEIDGKPLKEGLAKGDEVILNPVGVIDDARKFAEKDRGRGLSKKRSKRFKGAKKRPSSSSGRRPKAGGSKPEK